MHDPDKAWSYGPSIDFSGRMVEAVSGQRLGEFAQQNLFEPLGMDDTAFRITATQHPRLAATHARTPDGGLAPFERAVYRSGQVPRQQAAMV